VIASFDLVRYKVTFRKRFTPEGEPADRPTELVSVEDGVIEDSEMVEIVEPAGLGVAEDLNEGSGSQESNDNGFLGLGTESLGLRYRRGQGEGIQGRAGGERSGSGFLGSAGGVAEYVDPMISTDA
jgi:hypothetical protein